MENPKEIRWRQRFENFQKAFLKLKEAIEDFNKLDELAKEGLIQRFEYTYELAWKTIKDYLENQQVEAGFPRDVIKQAFKYNVIDNGEVWFNMHNQRNLLTHTYDEENFNKALQLIRFNYYEHLEKLYNYLKNEYWSN
ncbi:MAG: nucleotidyltransferase substrate binding protein [Bacteroidales bacterium]|nr:nucleotidyltransferase substrate binding protein [Bacteroidales bacterium]